MVENWVRCLKMKYRKLNSSAKETEYYLLTRKVWAVFAPLYNIAVRPLSKLRDYVVKWSEARRGSTILDVATGTGKQAFAFAKKGYRVTGIDISDAMLRVAIKNNKYTNVKFEVADASYLPFEDNTFNIASISFAIHDMPETVQKRVLREMARIVKPEGSLIIMDYALPRYRILGLLIYIIVRSYEGKYYVNFIKSDIRRLIKDAGIKITEEIPVLFGAGRIWKGKKKHI